MTGRLRSLGAGGLQAELTPDWGGTGHHDSLGPGAVAFLLDPERKLLSIGYSVPDNRLDENCYDLLASEARLASLFARAWPPILRGRRLGECHPLAFRTPAGVHTAHQESCAWWVVCARPSTR